MWWERRRERKEEEGRGEGGCCIIEKGKKVSVICLPLTEKNLSAAAAV